MTPRRRGIKAGAPKVEVLVQSSQWKREAKIAAHLRKAIAAAAARLCEKDAPKPVTPLPSDAGNVALALALSDDAAVRALNRDWRGQDKPTNVLSFPAPRGESAPGAPVHWGDVIIAYGTTAREAQEGGKPFADHAAHLAIHGFLHLAGYDHEKDTDAEVMEALERAILARIDIPDPYAS
ncbi:MAG: rRNA maturation RNase YbeY [Variibacter sp.]